MKSRPEAGAPWTLPRAYQVLLERLALGELSPLQAEHFLLRKGCPSEWIVPAIDECRQRGYIDESRLSELLQLRAQRLAWSPRRLRQEAFKRGLELESGAEPVDQVVAITKLTQAWLARGLDCDKMRQRLLTRGFSPAEVSRFFRENGWSS